MMIFSNCSSDWPKTTLISSLLSVSGDESILCTVYNEEELSSPVIRGGESGRENINIWPVRAPILTLYQQTSFLWILPGQTKITSKKFHGDSELSTKCKFGMMSKDSDALLINYRL